MSRCRVLVTALGVAIGTIAAPLPASASSTSPETPGVAAATGAVFSPAAMEPSPLVESAGISGDTTDPDDFVGLPAAETKAAAEAAAEGEFPAVGAEEPGVYSTSTHVGDGEYVLDVFDEPQHRPEEGDEMVELDDDVTVASGEVTAADVMVPVAFPGGDQIASFELGGDPVVVTSPDLDVDAPRLKADDSVVYNDVAPGVDLRYEVTTGQVKEEIVLADESALARFSFRIEDPEGRLGAVKRTPTGGWMFSGSGKDDQPLLRIPPAVAYELDDAGERVPELTPSAAPSAHVEVRAVDGGFEVETWVDADWVKGRSYPIALDPTYQWAWGRPGWQTNGNNPSVHQWWYQQHAGSCSTGDPLTCAAPVDNGFIYVGSTFGTGVDNRAIRSVLSWDYNLAASHAQASATIGIPERATVLDAQLYLNFYTCIANPQPTTVNANCGPTPTTVKTLEARRMVGSWSPSSTWAQIDAAKATTASTSMASNGQNKLFLPAEYDWANAGYGTGWQNYFTNGKWQFLQIGDIAQGWVNNPAQGAALQLRATAEGSGARGAGWYNTSSTSVGRRPYMRIRWQDTPPGDAPGSLTGTAVGSTVHATWNETTTGTWAPWYQTYLVNATSGVTVAASDQIDVGTPDDPTEWDFDGVAPGRYYLMSIGWNNAGASPWAQSAPFDVGVLESEGTSSTTGFEPWWSFERFGIGPDASASVNVANGNLVVQQTDTTPIQGHGRLSYVVRRTYNSQSPSSVGLIPTGPAAGWTFNVSSAGDFGGVGGLAVPTNPLSLASLPVTLVDRDGTRHEFVPRALTGNVLVGSGNGTSFTLATGKDAILGGLLGRGTSPTSALGSMVQLANAADPNLASNPLTLPGIGVCVDLAYNAPRGVHLSLWRFVAVDLGEDCSVIAPGDGPNDGDPMLLGYGLIRPDRVRQLFALTGQVLSDVDPAGNELRYGYQISGPAGLTVGRLAAVWEPESCSGNPAAVPADPAAATCRALRFGYGNGVVAVSDPAGRTTTYQIDSGRRLLSVTAKDPAGTLLETWTYTYEGVGGASCGAPTGKLCSVTAPNGTTTRFTYTGTKVWKVADRYRSSDVDSPTQAELTSVFSYDTASTDAVRGSRARRYTYDSALRVVELAEGTPAQVASGSGLARRTGWDWDSDVVGDTCRPVDNRPDHHLCGTTRYAGTPSTAGAPPDYPTPPNHTVIRTYNPEGQILSETTSMGAAPAIIRRWGYTAAYYQSGTSGSTPPASANDSIAGPSQPRPTSWVYAISDQVAVQDPRGNTTNFNVDADYTKAPGVLGAECGTTLRDGTTDPTPNPGNTGLVCHERRPDATVVSHTYGALGQRATTVSPRSFTTRYHYVADGTLDLSGSVNAGGWLKAVEDPDQNFVAFGHDAAGNVVRTWDRNATEGRTVSQYPASVNNPYPNFTEIRFGPGASTQAFDRPWRWPVSEMDQSGGTVTYTLDAHGNRLTTRSKRGNLTGTAAFDVTQTFNARDQLTRRTTPDLTASSSWQWRWDAHGGQIATIDPAGAATVTVFDDVGRATQTVRQRGPWASRNSAEESQCRQSTSGDAPIPAAQIVCTTRTAYDGLDRTVASTDGAGQATWNAFDPAGRTVATWAPRSSGVWLHSRSVYDANGNVLVSCPPREAAEGSGTVCTATSRYSTSHTYDELNRVDVTTRWREDSSATTGARGGWIALSTDTDYDDDGNVERVTDPRQVPIVTEWDGLGRRTRVHVQRDASTTITNEYRYDPAGNTTAEIKAIGTADQANTAYSYDSTMRLVDTVTAATTLDAATATPSSASSIQNLRTRRVYDKDGNVVGVYEPRAFTLGTTTNPDERYFSRVDYDAVGRPVAEWRPFWDDSVSSASRLYDDPATRDPEEECAKLNATTHRPDDVTGVAPYPSTVGVCVTRVGYDTVGRLVTIRAGVGALVTTAGSGGTNAVDSTATYAAPNRFATNVYTADGLLAEVQQPNPATTVDNAHRAEAGLAAQRRVRVQVNSYDGAGRGVASVDAADWQVDRTYTADGLVSVESGRAIGTPEETRTETTYDHAGQPIATTAMVNPGELETSPTRYNSDGTIYERENAAGHITRYRYDGMGNPTQVWTPRAVATGGAPLKTDFTNDNLAKAITQPLALDGSLNRVTDYLYDALGRTTSRGDKETNGSGTVLANAGAMISTWSDTGWITSHKGRGGTPTVTYGYDAAGHELSTANATAGTSTSRTFFLNDLVRSETDTQPGLSALPVGYRYFGDGREYSRALYTTLPSALEMFTATVYGDAGEVTASYGHGWGHNFSTWTHTYDRAGRMLTTTDPAGRLTEQIYMHSPTGDYITSTVQRGGGAGSSIIAKWAYYHDGLRRIDATNRTVNGVGLPSWAYDYDPAGRLVGWTEGSTTKTYGYDADGNRTSTPEGAFTYRADGSIATATPTGGSMATYGYNPAGGVTSDGCSTMAYDPFDRLSSSTRNLGGCTGAANSYTYLPDGRQASRTAGSTVTRNRWAAGAVLSEETAVAADTARYITTPMGSLAVSNAAATPVIQHLKDDGQGNTALLTRPSGTVTACGTAYDPWGSQIAQGSLPACTSSVTSNNVWYRGAARDPATGTYTWGNRTYNPTTGTWLTPDTFQASEAGHDLSIGTDPLTANRYSYVNGDPINNTDPSGHRIPCEDEFRTDSRARANCQRHNVEAARATADWARKRHEWFGDGPASLRLMGAFRANCRENFCGFFNGIYLPPSFFEGLDARDVTPEQAAAIAAFVGLDSYTADYFTRGRREGVDDSVPYTGGPADLIYRFLESGGEFDQLAIQERKCQDVEGVWLADQSCEVSRDCPAWMESTAGQFSYIGWLEAGRDLFEAESAVPAAQAAGTEAATRAAAWYETKKAGSKVISKFAGPVNVVATVVDAYCGI